MEPTLSITEIDDYKALRLDVIRNQSRAAWCEMCGRCLSAVVRASANIVDCNPYLDVIDDVILDTMSTVISRDYMPDFLEIFVFLAKCSVSTDDSVRRRTHPMLNNLLSNIEPVAQQLLICRIFEMVVKKEITIAMEQHFLAFLIDIYRRRLNHDECSEMFRNEISHFYGQICEVTYGDMINASSFYVAVLLFLIEHANRRFNLKLLQNMRSRILLNIREQLVNFRRITELQQQQQSDSKCEVSDIMNGPIFMLNLIQYQIENATKAIAAALSDGSSK